MSDKAKTLQNIVQEEYGKRGLEKLQIPTHISENLSKDLREYQQTALKYYLAQRELCKEGAISGNHLMFNMATGSGKTLIMAALMLDCFKQGYRNFIFFVNSTAILEKTRANFCKKDSSKYLFGNEIIIDNKRIEINTIKNLNESIDRAINIYFTTIQGLFSLFKNERENSLTLDDLIGQKLIFLADEAHHLNSETKKLNNEERDIKEGWESIVKKAFLSSKENMLLEFTATIPKENTIENKYRDKIIFKYDLAEFCKDGYSKRIFILKYENDSIEYRFLGACLMNIFRENVLSKNGEFIKPVILFKSEGIAKSNENEKKFIEFVESIDSSFVKEFYKNAISKNQNELLVKSYIFFKNEFGDSAESRLVELIKANFKKEFVLNANDEKQVEKNQILLNCLENKDNFIRAIFAVDKLNEGWDVLNLFDIVRLKNGNKNESKNITTKEAQLIGRGARYYPFLVGEFDKEIEFRRKFDNNIENDLSILERLVYHTRNEVEFIRQLNEAMVKEGLLFDNKKEKIILKPKEHLKQNLKNEKIYYVTNRRIKKDGLFKRYDEAQIKQELKNLEVPLIADGIIESEVTFKDTENEITNEFKKSKFLNEIEDKYYLKASNKLGLSFEVIKENFDVKSKSEFIRDYLGNIRICFHKNQEFNHITKLAIAEFVLKNFKDIRNKVKEQYDVSEFETNKLYLGERIVFTNKKVSRKYEFEWLFYDNFIQDSDLEWEFLEFIESNKEYLNKAFEKWFIVRNNGFNEFKIYDNRALINDNINPTYAKGFEPDFILFAKRHKENEIFGIECFIEAKGQHLAGDENFRGKDTWKEEFLEAIRGTQLEVNNKNNLTIHSLPFFIGKENEKFKAAFDRWVANLDSYR